MQLLAVEQSVLASCRVIAGSCGPIGCRSDSLTTFLAPVLPRDVKPPRARARATNAKRTDPRELRERQPWHCKPSQRVRAVTSARFTCVLRAFAAFYVTNSATSRGRALRAPQARPRPSAGAIRVPPRGLDLSGKPVYAVVPTFIPPLACGDLTTSRLTG